VRAPGADELAARALARAEAERAEAARAQDVFERKMWGGRPPSPRLRELGGNVMGVARSYRDLLDGFEALDAGAQRGLARWLARRAFEVAELDRVDWARAALDALDRGLALPEPFTDLESAFRRLRGSEATLIAVTRLGREPWPGPIHRPSFAIPAIFSALHPDPLQALVDTFSHAEATFHDRRGELVDELRRR
jgi:hypothetical protein